MKKISNISSPPAHGGYSPPPDPDVEAPIGAPHPSHRWARHDRYAVCIVCGVRDHWSAGGVACRGAPEAQGITLEVAIRRLERETVQFADWWRAKKLGARPTMNDWRAEHFEFSREPRK